MRFKPSVPPLLLALPLIAIAAPNDDGESAATTTRTSVETMTVTHTQVLITLTSTYPSLSYFPLIAPTQSVGGPLPDIPNPTLTPDTSQVEVVTQILVAPPSTTLKSTTSSRTSTSTSTVSVVSPVALPSGRGASSLGTVTTPLVIASATGLATPAPPIATYTGAAAGMKGCGSWVGGMALVGVAVGFAVGLL